MHDVSSNLSLVAPELILGGGALLLLMIGVFQGDRSLKLITWLSVACYAAAAVSLLGAPGSGGVAFDGLYAADAYATYLKMIVYAGAAASALLAVPYLTRVRTARFEYPILLLLSATGMSLMVSASDLLTLYVGLELQSLAAYVLAAFHRQEARSSEAGLKYFVLGALASGILLYGMSLVYGFTGTTQFAGIAAAIGAAGHSTGILFGIVFVLAGLAFKISAVPFHMWTPDVYEGAPTPVAAFFAGAPKAAAMGLLVRIAIDGFGGGAGQHVWQQVVVFASLASIILGAVGAIGQSNIKRLLAYSSINNVGFALIGLAAASREGVAAVLFYMVVYVAMTLGSFVCVLQMRDAEGRPVESIASLAGLSRTRPGLAAALAMFMFSLAGIPPLFGFWPKFLVFDAAVKADLVPLAVIGIASSVIGAFYYLKIVKTMYFDEPAPAYAPADNRTHGVLIAVSALFVSPLGYLTIPLLSAASAQAASALF
jgi:NADH-quinone oxidoreductase subunit N